MPLPVPSSLTGQRPVSAHPLGRHSSPISADRIIPPLLFICCFAYLCVFIRYSTLEPDEGIVLRGAERILGGQIPYRDFFSFYTPGSFYLVAALFRIFGNSFAVARISLAVVGALCSLITYLLAKRVCSPGISALAAVLATTTGAAFRFLVLHNPYSTLGSCITIYAGLRFIETQKSWWIFATTSFASITFLTEQSKGAGLFLGLALALMILQFRSTTLGLTRSAIAGAVVGSLWPFIITFAYFAVHHAAGPMVQDWFWPLRHYTRANHVPYGFQNWSDDKRNKLFFSGSVAVRIVRAFAVSPDILIPALPLVAVAVLAHQCVATWRQSFTSRDSQYYVLVGSMSAGLLLSVIAVRPDILHFMYLAPLWYVMLAWILGAPESTSRMLLRARPYILGYTASAFGLLSLILLLSANGARFRVETPRGVIRTNEPDTVIDYVQANTVRGEEMLVYPYLPLYNYLTATSSPTRYDFFQPGMNTRLQADEIVSSLSNKKVKAVLFEPWFMEKMSDSWPGTKMEALATDPVADFIARNYRICKLLNSPEGWRFEYMVLRNTACPETL
jgi:4-amino-4-deoxy-L-arabinose transferase-like glycosyltransferase